MRLWACCSLSHRCFMKFPMLSKSVWLVSDCKGRKTVCLYPVRVCIVGSAAIIRRLSDAHCSDRCEGSEREVWNKGKNWESGKEMPDFFPPSLLPSPLSWCYPRILCLIFNPVFSSYPPDHLASPAHILYYFLHIAQSPSLLLWGVSYCNFLSVSHLGFRRWQWNLWHSAFLLTALALRGDSIISDVLMSHSIYKSASQGEETGLWAVIVSRHKARCRMCSHRKSYPAFSNSPVLFCLR